MDDGTWNRLSEEEQKAVRSLSSGLPQKVAKTGFLDGWDFSKKFTVRKEGGEFVISDGKSSLSGIKHPNKRVIDALMTDIIQNYGR
jgi:hypothetical protein